MKVIILNLYSTMHSGFFHTPLRTRSFFQNTRREKGKKRKKETCEVLTPSYRDTRKYLTSETGQKKLILDTLLKSKLRFLKVMKHVRKILFHTFKQE